MKKIKNDYFVNFYVQNFMKSNKMLLYFLQEIMLLKSVKKTFRGHVRRAGVDPLSAKVGEKIVFFLQRRKTQLRFVVLWVYTVFD